MNFCEVNKKNKFHTAILANHDETCGYFIAGRCGSRINFEQTWTTCHSDVRDQPVVEDFWGALYSTDGTAEWWNYLTEQSMFVDLFQMDGWETLTENGKPIGFHVPNEAWKVHIKPFPYMLLYSFLIESRVPFERQYALKSFLSLTKLGVAPRLAHIMSVMIDEKGLWGGNNWDGNHKFLWDNGNRPIDFRAVLAGKYKYNPSITSVSSFIWNTDQPRRTLYTRAKPIVEKFGECIEIKGRFHKEQGWIIPQDKIVALSKAIEGIC